MTALAIAIFVATLTMVIWQPRGLSIGWSACAGAGLALLLHVVTLHNVVTVTGIVWDATLTFVSIIITSTVLDRVGFFEWAALKMAHAARGSGQRAFVYVILLGAMVSAFFANDGAALILTPIVLEKVRLLKFDDKKMLPFIMAGGFIADTASLPLVVSNLVNIVSADYFHIGFLTYLIRMVAPDLVSIGASLLVLWLYFRRDVPTHYDPANLPAAKSAIADERMFKLSWLILAVLLVGYLCTEILHIPVSSVAGVIALVFLLVGGARGVVKPWRIVREAPWAIVFFSIGMYVVVYGLKNVGLTALLGTLVAATSHAGAYVSVLSVGFLAAILSSVMNNMPSVMIGALALHGVGVSAAHHAQLVYANIIGCDLGPKITPIGSLATLLWLDVLRKKGVTITWRRYFRTGLVLTVPTLFLTLSGLYAWSLLSLH